MKAITSPDINVYGAHRGGGAATSELLGAPGIPKLTVRIVDPQPGRARELATAWETQRHDAFPITVAAESIATGTRPTVAVLATDNPTSQCRLFRDSAADLTVAGIIVATTERIDGDGIVFGIGAICPREDRSTRRDGIRLFETIESLTGGQRATSAAVTSPFANGLQAAATRGGMYGLLAGAARLHLTGHQQGGSTFVCMSLPDTETHEVTVADRNGRSRREMCNAARHQATIYLDHRNRSWMFVALPLPFGEWVTMELPTSPALDALRVVREPAPPRIYATD